MEHHSNPWSVSADAIRQGQTPVLVAVVDHQGSVPGKPGALMVVTPSAVVGTIGGGLVEHQFIETARKRPNLQLTTFTHDGDTSDSICSGRQRLAVMPLGSEHLEAILQLAAIVENGRAATLRLSDTGIEVHDTAAGTVTFTEDGATWSSTIPIGPLDVLTIVGGGHVGLALSRVMSTLPFHIVVLDDRGDLPTMKANRWAHAFCRVPWDEVPTCVPEGPRSWAVIMTPGHRHDLEVLRKLLPLDLRYLGMMGSQAKVRQIFDQLTGEGVPRQALDRVQAPIGVPIASHTPEEIAISIAAEIIRIRNTSTED